VRLCAWWRNWLEQYREIWDGRVDRLALHLVTSRMICLDELLAMAGAGWVTQLDKLEPLLAGGDPHPGA
jgi:hypothetical protein